MEDPRPRETSTAATSGGSAGQPGRGLTRFAWLPIPILLAAILAGRAAGLRESYESDALRLVVSFAFYTLVSLETRRPFRYLLKLKSLNRSAPT